MVGECVALHAGDFGAETGARGGGGECFRGEIITVRGMPVKGGELFDVVAGKQRVADIRHFDDECAAGGEVGGECSEEFRRLADVFEDVEECDEIELFAGREARDVVLDGETARGFCVGALAGIGLHAAHGFDVGADAFEEIAGGTADIQHAPAQESGVAKSAEARIAVGLARAMEGVEIVVAAVVNLAVVVCVKVRFFSGRHERREEDERAIFAAVRAHGESGFEAVAEFVAELHAACGAAEVADVHGFSKAWPAVAGQACDLRRAGPPSLR